MPTDDTPSTEQRPRPGTGTREEQRARRAARVREARQQAARGVSGRRMQVSLARLLRTSRAFRDHRVDGNTFEEAKMRLEADNAHLHRVGVRPAIGAVLGGVAKYAAILTIDLCLLAGVSHFLISLVYQREGGAPLWAMVPVPVAILILELVIARQIAGGHEGTETAASHGWRTRLGWGLAGVILALVIPALGTVALLMAISPVIGRMVPLVRHLLVVGVVALALVCHASVIFGGASAMDDMTWLAFLLRRWRLERRIRRQDRGAQLASDRARDSLLAYEAALATYGEQHGQPPRHLLIQARDVRLVNDAVGETVVQMPDGTGPAPAPRIELDPTPAPEESSGNGGKPPSPRIAAAAAFDDGPEDGGREENAAEAHSGEDREGAENEYLRRILEAQRRDLDGEVSR